MMRLVFFLPFLFLAACGGARGTYPQLEPLDQLLAPEPPAQTQPAGPETDALVARADALKARADALRRMNDGTNASAQGG